MDTAIRYVEQMNELVDLLLKAGHRSVEVQKGRRFDRVLVNGEVRYFVEHDTHAIFGAKSATQYNTRREYGTLALITQYEWLTGTPLPNTEAFTIAQKREAAIVSNYKKRGRPRKNTGAP